ncbi:Glycosyl hydrolase family 26 [Actinoplanes derwentensis]|uniref:Glycosyl hydrolase family 26 n=2 Tax=Actinoplanes derwentensis TaxID=113562 RepID=A0A1H2DB96_9ACTN|nr:Glycosyl hydrolase family 26 [Actinoplanes derwentensis]
MLTLLALTGAAGCGTATATSAATQPSTVAGTPTAAPSTAATARLGSAATATSAATSASASASASASKAAPSSAPATAGAGPSGRGGPVQAPTGKVLLGSYLALGGKNLKQSLSLRRGQLDREQRIVHRFYPWNGYVPTSEPDVAKSSTLMVSWHGAPYAGILNGGSNTNIRSVARKLKNMKRPILLRWGWEMNGDWFEWGGAQNGQSPANYVKAWKRLHRIFAEQGADNVAWVWSPNWNSSPNVSWNKVQNYYPGDEYVDWVGISGYNFYNETPSTLFNPITSRYGSRKPIILSETAAVKNKAKWIKQLHTWVEKTPAVGAVVWFDTDIQQGTDHNFRFDTDTAALSAYRTMARSSRFTG